LSKSPWAKLYRNGAKVYRHVQRDYIKSLPVDPLVSLNLKKSVFKFLTKDISKEFDPIIQEELSFYVKHHDELEDQQDGGDMGNLLKFVKETENFSGDVLELGTYKGGTTVMLARFLKKIGSKRKIFSCDAFIGLPTDDKFSRTKNAKGKYSDCDPDSVLRKFQKFGVDDKIILIEGLFEKTLYDKLAEQKFSLVFVDCDLYDTTKFCLDFVFPRLSEGGIIMFDDYDRAFKENPTWGETRAADEFCSSKKIKINLEPVPHIKK